MLPAVVRGGLPITRRRQALVVARRWLAEARRWLAPICGRGHGGLWPWGLIGRHSFGRFDPDGVTLAGLYRHVGSFLAIDVQFHA